MVHWIPLYHGPGVCLCLWKLFSDNGNCLAPHLGLFLRGRGVSLVKFAKIRVFGLSNVLWWSKTSKTSQINSFWVSLVGNFHFRGQSFSIFLKKFRQCTHHLCGCGSLIFSHFQSFEVLGSPKTSRTKATRTASTLIGVWRLITTCGSWGISQVSKKNFLSTFGEILKSLQTFCPWLSVNFET